MQAWTSGHRAGRQWDGPTGAAPSIDGSVEHRGLAGLATELEAAGPLLAQLTHAIARSNRPTGVHQQPEREIDKVALDDMTFLAALARKSAGGAVWEWFRSSAADLMGKQPLPGELIVLVSRL